MGAPRGGRAKLKSPPPLAVYAQGSLGDKFCGTRTKIPLSSLLFFSCCCVGEEKEKIHSTEAGLRRRGKEEEGEKLQGKRGASISVKKIHCRVDGRLSRKKTLISVRWTKHILFTVRFS